MTTYPFRQGIDYGSRKGTLGLALHMSEGGDGLVAYLAKRSGETVTQWRTRVRGVSANACILSDGTVWQMVDWDNASGSMNPADRASDDKGYFGAEHLRAALGPHWPDPNAWSISVEIAGYRTNGPTDAQVQAAIAWGLDMRERYPTLRGAFGHADQTDTKGCPGSTPNLRAIFDGLGGHGLWAPDTSTEVTSPMLALNHDPAQPTLYDVPPGTDYYFSPSGKRMGAFPSDGLVRTVEYVGTPFRPDGTLDDDWRLVTVTVTPPDGVRSAKAAYVRRADIANPRKSEPQDCTAAVAAATGPLERRLATANDRIRSAAIALGATPG